LYFYRWAYKAAQPIKENIEKINKLYDSGYTIVYLTVRGYKVWTDVVSVQHTTIE
jgi:hypothetical protein